MKSIKVILYLALLSVCGASFAQDAPAPASTAATPDQILDQARDQLDGIAKALKSDEAKDPQAIDGLRAQAIDAQGKAQQVTAELSPQLDAVTQRLTDFGPAPTKGTSEAPDVAAQRRDLQKQHDSIDSQIKQAKDTATLSAQLAGQLADIKRTQFQAQITNRVASPLTRDFWVGPTDTFTRDRAELAGLWADTRADFAKVMTPPNRLPFLACLICGLLLLTLVRWLIERTVFRLTTNRVPAGKLRRSSMALGITLVSTLTTGFAAQLIYLGLTWHDVISDDVKSLAHSFANIVFFGALIAGLSRSLLSPKRPSWRLPALSDRLVEKVKALPRLIAVAGVLMVMGYRINSTIGASVNAGAMLNFFISLLISVLFGTGVVQLARAHREPTEDGSMPPPRPAWANILILVAGVAVVVIWLAAFTGYVTLAVTIALQMTWIGMVAAGTYLLMHLVDDLFDTLLSSRSHIGERAQRALGIGGNKLDQISVLLSGVSRVVLFLFGLMLSLRMFGTGPSDVLEATRNWSDGIVIGADAKIKPDNIIYGILTFFIGMAVVRVLKRWFETRLLPSTTIDEGMRSSITTLLGYLGGVIVFAIAMLRIGLSVQNVTWVASALSVGIGFGLQAIVSNFISGLILLAERPVKVGDWVVLDDAEGDIRRINVRATEIQMADRSTVIVPNSSLITKTVRNMTLANPQGRVLIKLPMPLDTDAGQARDLIMKAMTDHPKVLETPAPSVSLDSIDASAMTFSAVAYVGGPRDAGGVKSDLLFDILLRLRTEEIPLIRPQDMVIRGGHIGAPQPEGGSTTLKSDGES